MNNITLNLNLYLSRNHLLIFLLFAVLIIFTPVKIHAAFPPSINKQPEDQTVKIGKIASFTVLNNESQWIVDTSQPANPDNSPFIPEMFFGRITPKKLKNDKTGSETEMIKKYLTRITDSCRFLQRMIHSHPASHAMRDYRIAVLLALI